MAKLFDLVSKAIPLKPTGFEVSAYKFRTL